MIGTCIFCEKITDDGLAIAPVAAGFSYTGLPGGATYVGEVPADTIATSCDPCWRSHLQAATEDDRIRFAVHPKLGPMALAPQIALPS